MPVPQFEVDIQMTFAQIVPKFNFINSFSSVKVPGTVQRPNKGL